MFCFRIRLNTICLGCLLPLLTSVFARADILRWDNGQLIPGTEGITPGPGVRLVHHELGYAELSKRNLTDSLFDFSNLTSARLHDSTLTNANLAGAVVAGANFGLTTSSGFTKEQLYSTASYQQKNLQGIGLEFNDLTGWNFSGQNLTSANLNSANLTNVNLAGAKLSNASLLRSTLTNTNLAGADVTDANFGQTTSSGFTKEQLYSTASYQQKNLQGIGLGNNDLTGWDFSGQVVIGANFIYARGFAKEQLYSTASYHQKNLQGIRLGNDLTGWNFSGQNLVNAFVYVSNLTNANFAGADLTNAHLGAAEPIGESSTLTNANLAGANLTGAHLNGATLTNADLTSATVTGAKFNDTTSRGFTKEQLYSTASYQQKNLQGITLASNELTGWDFSGQNLTNADLSRSTLMNVNLSGAVVTGARFDDTTSGGFTKEQLYSTESYQQKRLHNINLQQNDLTGWDLAGQNLTRACFVAATLTNADLSFADLRGANLHLATGKPITRNTILFDGKFTGLDLAAGETLVAYPGVPTPVQVSEEYSIAPNAKLDLTDNAAIVDYTGASPVASVREKILSGRGGPGPGGAWNGTGISSSTAAAANQTAPDSRSLGYAENATLPLGPYTTFHGAAVDGTSVLIAFTRTGDANLDGVVNDDDVTIVGATYAPGIPQPSWALGDFDYNGFVDDDDVTLLGAFYDPSAVPLTAPPVDAAAVVSAVPEPASVTLVLFAFAAAAVAAMRSGKM